MRIAIIGMGEVGRCYAEPLRSPAIDLSLCEARPSPRAMEIATGAHCVIHPAIGSWVSAAEIVLSFVTGAQSAAVVQTLLPHLQTGAVIADFTTASPDIKRANAAAATAQGQRYVDVAVMGAISLHGVRTPLLIAGDGGRTIHDLMTSVGARTKLIEGGTAGDAMSLKILRSVFTKGMEALSVELLMSAEKQGLRQKLYEQLSDIDETPLRAFLDMLVRTHVVHAERRLHEVRDARAALAAQGLPSQVLSGVEERFRTTAERLKRDSPRSDDSGIDDALTWLLAPRTAA